MSEKVMVVDDKQIMRDSVGATLMRAGFTVVAASDGASAERLVARHRPAAVITDLKMPEMDGLELLERLQRVDETLPVVLMTAFGTIDVAVGAMKRGAFDFIQKPFEGDQLVMTIRRAVEHRRLVRENQALKAGARETDGPTLVGQSAAMRKLAHQIQQIARSHGTVLISGESGTGKEVVARTIHANSPRASRVMLCLNCAALSSSLLESELFGHEKGAFTGADQLRKGRFELSDGGTLMLDEISEIEPTIQAKLLRVLQEQQFERVGSSATMDVDVRVIATTNRDLGRCVADGSFRQDLFYRLNVLPIVLPPLRARYEDIPLLAEHFLRRVALREGREAKQFDSAAIECLQGYSWPGNVRELENICERASVLTRGMTIEASVIEPWLMLPSTAHPGQEVWGAHANGGLTAAAPGRGGHISHGGGAMMGAGQQKLEVVERTEILRTLDQYGGNRRRTAEALGIGVRTLGLKLKKWKDQQLVSQSV